MEIARVTFPSGEPRGRRRDTFAGIRIEFTADSGGLYPVEMMISDSLGCCEVYGVYLRPATDVVADRDEGSRMYAYPLDENHDEIIGLLAPGRKIVDVKYGKDDLDEHSSVSIQFTFEDDQKSYYLVAFVEAEGPWYPHSYVRALGGASHKKDRGGLACDDYYEYDGCDTGDEQSGDE
jgi:hypothetical protein